MKRFLLVAAVFAAVAMAAHAAAPLRDNSSPMSTPAAGWDAVAQAFRSLLLDANGALVVSGNFSIASATINSVQPFVTPSGVASSSKMDTSDRLVVNVGSQSGTLAVSVTSLPAVTAGPTGYATDPVNVAFTSTPSVNLASQGVVVMGTVKVDPLLAASTISFQAHGAVDSVRWVAFTLSSGSVKLLSSIASFTLPSAVSIFSTTTTIYVGSSTGTLAAVAASDKLAPYDHFDIVLGDPLLDVAMVATSTAGTPTASCSLRIIHTVP